MACNRWVLKMKMFFSKPNRATEMELTDRISCWKLFSIQQEKEIIWILYSPFIQFPNCVHTLYIAKNLCQNVSLGRIGMFYWVGSMVPELYLGVLFYMAAQ